MKMRIIALNLTFVFIIVLLIAFYNYPRQTTIPGVAVNFFDQDVRFDHQLIGNQSGIHLCDSSKGAKDCGSPLQSLSGDQNLSDLTDAEVENRFYELIMRRHIECAYQKRFGHLKDGGWEMCLVQPYYPSQDCLVYSIGINYDFSFDDAISKLKCTVRCFDPTTKMLTHDRSEYVHFYKFGIGSFDIVSPEGWHLKTFGSLLKKFNEENKVVDYLKIDVEYAEWGAFITMIKEGSLKNVKQLSFEIHTRLKFRKPKENMILTRDDYIPLYEILYQLEKIGFRRYRFHVNPSGKFKTTSKNKKVSCCLELFYININFLNKDINKL